MLSISNQARRALRNPMHPIAELGASFPSPAEIARRQYLFAAARRGDKRAHADLWRLYRLRLLPPPARPRMSKRHAK